MNEREMRITIAVACGWTWEPTPIRRPDKRWLVSPNGREVCTVWKDGDIGGQLPPDYVNDLNAMRDAVEYLRENGNQFQWLEFERELFRVVWDSDPKLMHSSFYLGSAHSYHTTNATARQRAEAFLRTLHLWKP